MSATVKHTQAVSVLSWAMSFDHLKRNIWHQMKFKTNSTENTQLRCEKNIPWQRLIADLWNFRSQQNTQISVRNLLRDFYVLYDVESNDFNSSYESVLQEWSTVCDRSSQFKPVDYILPYWKLPSHRLHLDLIFARWCLSESQPKNCPLARRCRRQVHSSLLKSLLCYKFSGLHQFFRTALWSSAEAGINCAESETARLGKGRVESCGTPTWRSMFTVFDLMFWLVFSQKLLPLYVIQC